MKIFIGSSSEARDHMRTVGSWIEAIGHETLCWDDNALFPPGEYAFNSLIEIAKK